MNSQRIHAAQHSRGSLSPVLVALTLLLGPIGCEKDKSAGADAIAKPSDCHTALARTTSCRGRDDSWIECRYHLRAEGVPDPKVCSAFIAAGSTGPLDAKPLPGSVDDPGAPAKGARG